MEHMITSSSAVAVPRGPINEGSFYLKNNLEVNVEYLLSCLCDLKYVSIG